MAAGAPSTAAEAPPHATAHARKSLVSRIDIASAPATRLKIKPARASVRRHGVTAPRVRPGVPPHTPAILSEGKWKLLRTFFTSRSTFLESLVPFFLPTVLVPRTVLPFVAAGLAKGLLKAARVGAGAARPSHRVSWTPLAAS